MCKILCSIYILYYDLKLNHKKGFDWVCGNRINYRFKKNV